MSTTLSLRFPKPVFALMAGIALWGGGAGPAKAAESDSIASQPDYGELNAVLDFDPNPENPHIETPGSFDRYFDWKQDFAERNDLLYLVEYGVISQWGSRGDDRFHANHELNLSGMWALTESPSLGTGSFIGWVQNAVTLGGVTTTELMQELGVLTPLNGGDTFPGKNATRLNHFAWEQRLPGDKARIMVGKLTTRILMNQNRYTVSDREDFFTPMVVNNPVVPFTVRQGMGIFGEWKNDSWYLSGMVREADSTEDWLGTDFLSTSNWEYLVEAGWTPTLEGLGQGYYRVTYDYTDAIGSGGSAQPAGWSLSVSIDQDIGEQVGAYFRHAYADTPFRTFRNRTTMGVQILSPFGYPNDRIGLGWWRGSTTDPALPSESGLEVFWKLRLTRNIEFTPDLQLILDPALAPGRSRVWVGGLRLRLEF